MRADGNVHAGKRKRYDDSNEAHQRKSHRPEKPIHSTSDSGEDDKVKKKKQ